MGSYYSFFNYLSFIIILITTIRSIYLCSGETHPTGKSAPWSVCAAFVFVMQIEYEIKHTEFTRHAHFSNRPIKSFTMKHFFSFCSMLPGPRGSQFNIDSNSTVPFHKKYLSFRGWLFLLSSDCGVPKRGSSERAEQYLCGYRDPTLNSSLCHILCDVGT